jgi:NitT/TauT family transport system substrate-binding protein
VNGIRKSARVLAPIAVCVLALLAAASLTGCGGSARATTIRIGTLPTEDALPLYAALQIAGPPSPFGTTTSTVANLALSQGLDLQMTTFASAQERDAALVAGKIDGFMGDVLAAASLTDKGTPVKIVTIMLGATANQGRFGIVVPKNSPIKDASQLRGVPIATSSNTITEYVIDRLLQMQGFAPSEIKTVEVKQLPVRVQLLLAGQLKAAALPDPLLAFAQSQGARLLIDDTGNENLSQTVLVLRADFLKKNLDAAQRLIAVDAQAVKDINADPEKFRPLLIKEGKLPAAIAKSYKLNVYPDPQLPQAADVQPLLDWARAKGLVHFRVKYPDLVAPQLYQTGK